MSIKVLDIIKEAYQITWKYRYLWLFGFIIALTSGGVNFQPTFQYQTSTGTELDRFYSQFISFVEKYLIYFIVAAIALFIILIILWLLGLISHGGLIDCVNKIDRGEVTGLIDGFQTGFKKFWTLLGTTILLILPVIILVLIITIPFVILIISSAMSLRGDNPAGVFSLIFAICFFCFGLIILILLSLIMYLILNYALNAIIIDNHQIVASIKFSIKLIREKWKDTGLMFLVLLGISMGVSLIFAVITLIGILLPLGLIIAGFLTKSLALIAIGFGIILLVILATKFLQGILMVFTSSSWTITYLRLTRAITTE